MLQNIDFFFFKVMNGRGTDGEMEEGVDGWMDGWMDGWIKGGREKWVDE